VVIIRSEETRRGLMLETPVVENLVMIVNRALTKTIKVKSVVYLLQQTYTSEKRWKFHGKPPSRDWAPQNRDKERGKTKGGQSHIATETKEENK